MSTVYVVGHKKPDTDAVVSAIGLSYLKNKLGMTTKPMVLGNINNETKFVLDYFKHKVPEYLNDVKLQIKDLEYGKNHAMIKDANILDAFNYMNDNYISNIPVIENNKDFIGTISMKDISRDLIKGDYCKLHTSYNNILNVLKGKKILSFDDDIEGNVIIAAYRSTTFMENTKLSNEDILIVGDRHSIIEYAVNSKIKLLILTGISKIKDEHLEIAKKNHVNIIKTNLDTFETARTIMLSKPISELMTKDNVITFNENDEVSDFVDVANKTKYSYFPVINNENKCLGVIKLTHVATKKKKQVILVDHNEYEQSVDGLEEAEILEIIDHHKIGSIATNNPINFRNMPVGSSSTIVALMFKENHIVIPKDIAGLLLSGIISDTLLFLSPTTTDIDRKVVDELSTICNIDYNEYGLEMFKAGSELKGKTEEEIYYTDFKNFTISGKKFGISQVSTISVNDIIDNKDKYIEIMNNLARNNDYDVAALFVTDILNNGSYIFYNEDSYEILDNCFSKDLKEGMFLDGVISRKKQIIPTIMEHI